MKIKIEIWELNSRGKEKMTNNGIFDNRKAATDFIESYGATHKPYKMLKNIVNFVMK